MKQRDRGKHGDRAEQGIRQSARSQTYLIAGAIFVLTLVVFSRCLSNDFIYFYDDEEYVAGNQNIANGLTLSSLKYIATGICVANWHPVTMFSHALDVQIFGLQPWGHHLTSIVLHAVNAVLVFLLLRGATGATGRSALVAVLFALHPLRVQSVAMIAQRKDLLSTLFLLLALHAYANRRPNDKFMIRTIGWLVMSLLSKPMAVTLPVLMLLLDYWPLKRLSPAPSGAPFDVRQLARLIIEKWPPLVVSIAMSVVTVVVQSRAGATASLDLISLSHRISNAILACAAYIRLAFWPTGLAAYYPYPHVFPIWKTAAAAALLLAITGAAVWQWKKRPYFIVGWLWYLVALLPVIGIVQVGRQSMADRYTYVPHLGLAVALVWGLHEATERSPKRRAIAAAVSVAALAGFIPCTWIQQGYWANTEVLWKRALAVTTDNYPAEKNLRDLYFGQDRLKEALPHAYEVFRMVPEPDQASDLAWLLQGVGRSDEALAVLLDAKAKYPESDRIYSEFGKYYVKKQDFDKAEEYFAQMPSTTSDAEVRIAVFLAKAGNQPLAERHFKKAMQLDPNNPRAQFGYGQLLEDKGDRDAALRAYHEALRLDPNLPDVRARVEELESGKSPSE